MGLCLANGTLTHLVSIDFQNTMHMESYDGCLQVPVPLLLWDNLFLRGINKSVKSITEMPLKGCRDQ